MQNYLLLKIVAEEDMLALGKMLAKISGESAIIYLYGNLGAGKTTLVRGLLQSLSDQLKVKSPTYTLVEEYRIAERHILHFDLYRLTNAEELAYIGIQDYFSEKGLALIEWPEKGKGWLPPPDLSCYIDAAIGPRNVRIEANSTEGMEILGRLNGE